jgi:hypothetical protein
LDEFFAVDNLTGDSGKRGGRCNGIIERWLIDRERESVMLFQFEIDEFNWVFVQGYFFFA